MYDTYRNLRAEKLQNKKYDTFHYHPKPDKLSVKIMKKILQYNYRPQNNPLCQSSILKKYYEDVQQQAIKIHKRQKGQFVECSNQRKVNLKYNPYVKALNNMELIMKKNLLSSFFQYNQKKNVRMTQDQINLRKRMNKKNQNK